MCLTIQLILFASTTEIQLLLSSQFTVGAPVCIAKYSMYLRITSIFFTVLYMYLISPSVELDAISS